MIKTLTTIHRGDGFLMKPTLNAHNIEIGRLYTIYSRGANPMYSREHLSRIINGKRPVPVELAKDIADKFNFNWTEFYELESSKVKTIDAGPCNTHDFRIIFKSSSMKMYTPSDFSDTHYAITGVGGKDFLFFGNQTGGVTLFNKTKIEPESHLITEMLAKPILVQIKKPKDWYAGFLTGFSRPVGEKSDYIYLSDIQNTRSVSFKQSDIKFFCSCEWVSITPHWVE